MYQYPVLSAMIVNYGNAKYYTQHSSEALEHKRVGTGAFLQRRYLVDMLYMRLTGLVEKNILGASTNSGQPQANKPTATTEHRSNRL